MPGRYNLVWEFHVLAGSLGEFEKRYGPDGDWARLFRSAPGYIDTSLLFDLATPGRYLTIDRWQSQQAYDAFRSSQAAAYDALDGECENMTVGETFLGAFVDVT
jgi:heme-degrading monooxygenase HmoA